MAGTLYLVSTPIGNLEDITLRALRVLREADVIAAEDTRHSRKLLAHYKIETPLVANHQHTSPDQTAALVARIVAGEDVAVVTDAGTPGISDPSYALVCAAIAAGLSVVPIPGASAALTGLVASGLPPARFVFEGFIPRTGVSRRERLALLAQEARTIILYEAGNRTSQTLADLSVAFGATRAAAVCRELTKAFEEFRRGTLSELASYYKSNAVRGEVTIIIAGVEDGSAVRAGASDITGEDPDIMLRRRLKESLADGLTERDSVRAISEELKLSKRLVYATMLEIASGSVMD